MAINAEEVRKEWSNLSDKGKQEFLDSLSQEDVQNLTQALSSSNQTALDRTGQIADAINRGVTDFLGIPGQTAQNIMNLGRAGFGTVATMMGRPDLAPDIDESQALLGGEHIRSLVNRGSQSLGAGNNFAFYPERPVDKTQQNIRTVFEPVGQALAGTGAVVKSVGSQVPTMIQNPMLRTVAEHPTGVLAGDVGFSLAGGGSSLAAQELFPESPTAQAVAPLAPALLTVGAIKTGQAAKRVLGTEKAITKRAGLKSDFSKGTDKTDQFQRNVRKGLNIESKTGVDLDLASLTDNPDVRNLMSEAAGTNQKKAVVSLAKRVRDFGRVLHNAVGKFKTSKKGTDVLKAYQGEIDKARNTQLSLFREGLDDIHTKTGGKSIVSTKNVIDKINAEKSRLVSENPKITSKIQSELDVLDEELKRLSGGSKGLSAKNVQSFLADWTEKRSGTGRELTDMKTSQARRIYNFLFDTLDSELEKSAGKNPWAGKLRQMRSDYKLLGDYIDELSNTRLGVLINKKGAVDSDDVVRAFKTMSPEKIKYALPIIEKNDPGVINAVRRDYFDDILKRSALSEGKSRVAGNLDLTKLGNNWKIDNRFLALFQDRGHRKDLVTIRKLLRRVAGEHQTGSTESFTTGRINVGGVIFGMTKPGGQSGIFAVREYMRRTTPELLSNVFFDPKRAREFKSALQGIMTEAPMTRKQAAARLNALQTILVEESNGN